MAGAVRLSMVIPVYDEEDNVVLLYPKIEEACAPLGIRFETIFVDDCSKDRTWERLQGLEPGAGELVLVRLRRNAGQTPAMAAGFEVARGEILVTMDGDLQNDPSDIPALLEKIEAGHDLVCGWRKNRQDKLVTRKIPSKCANWIIRRVTGVTVHDYGCSLKAYRRPLIQRMRLYSDMHRFLPFLSQQSGARVDEVVVKHHPRIHGVTKYGLSRIFKVVFDLLSMKVIVHYHQKLFLWFAMMSLPVLGLFGYFLYRSFVTPVASRQIVWGITAVIGSLGVFIVMLGLLSELILRSHRERMTDLLVVDSRTGDVLQ